MERGIRDVGRQRDSELQHEGDRLPVDFLEGVLTAARLKGEEGPEGGRMGQDSWRTGDSFLEASCASIDANVWLVVNVWLVRGKATKREAVILEHEY